MYREQHGVYFNECHDTSLTKFLESHAKLFTFTPLKGQEFSVDDRDAHAARELVRAASSAPCELRRRHERGEQRYTAADTVLVLGDGDFSFSTSVVAGWGTACNFTATSLDTLDELEIKYGERIHANIRSLVAKGARVLHSVDATQLAGAHLGRFRFAVFNFPHTGADGGLGESIRSNRQLLLDFFSNVQCVLAAGSEVHVTVVHRFPYTSWRVEELGGNGLAYCGSVPFAFADFPSYVHVASTQTSRDTRYELESNLTHIWQRTSSAAVESSQRRLRVGSMVTLRWASTAGHVSQYTASIIRKRASRRGRKYLLQFIDGAAPPIAATETGMYGSPQRSRCHLLPRWE
jgi:25S rRNA (uracil2634-N3)-methyltransferase